MTFFQTRRRLLACLGSGLALLAVARAPAHAQGAAPSDAQSRSFVENFGGKLVGIVNSDQSVDAKKQAVLPLLQQNVDVALIGKFCLGRYWRNATPDQQKQYLALFDHVLVNAITDRIGDYHGVQFTVTGTSTSAAGTLVNATITRPGQPTADMQLLVSNASGTVKVADLIGEGASLSLTQRQDYGSYLARHGGNVQALIDALQHQIDHHH